MHDWHWCIIMMADNLRPHTKTFGGGNGRKIIRADERQGFCH